MHAASSPAGPEELKLIFLIKKKKPKKKKPKKNDRTAMSGM